ncbi:MAG: aromatic amino acid ammonia-lyase [Planctomycetaceae bacterium]|nr:aromatic amino acid ammonia-lyase [Planctomycetaceae bacterium]
MSKTLLEPMSLSVSGEPLTLSEVCRVAAGKPRVRVTIEGDVRERLQASVDLVAEAVTQDRSIYGVTTGFGGMAQVTVDGEQAAASQNNLLSFLATGAGAPIDPQHVRAAMLLRANVLARGCSGVRPEIVERLVRFLNEDATPIVRELGSIGASGDLVPLSVVARAMTGQTGFVRVQHGGQVWTGTECLERLGLEPIALQPKEGLAIVNGTSFSSAIAANCSEQTRRLLAVALGVQTMMLQALQVHEEPFEEFVHRHKPHPGQVWSAAMLRRLLREGRTHTPSTSPHVQDRYSLRCLPQYLGAIVEGVARVRDVVETEMNSVSDNPLIDAEGGQFYQSGNFLGQYVGMAMDDLRRYLGLLAKHLDVQIATLVAPEFNNGLPASLQGCAEPAYNMGLKGLQITGNSIMPLLTWAANPLVEHFPTHAEQFNQNINGLSWGSASLCWRSVDLFRHYLSVSLLFAVQALDLRAHAVAGHYDGRALLGTLTTPLYEAVCQLVGSTTGPQRPLVKHDADQWLEEYQQALHGDLSDGQSLVRSVATVLQSFDDEFVGRTTGRGGAGDRR